MNSVRQNYNPNMTLSDDDIKSVQSLYGRRSHAGSRMVHSVACDPTIAVLAPRRCLSVSLILSICLSVFLSVCLSACLSVCLFVRPFVRPTIHKSIHRSIRLSIHPSIHPAIHPSIHLQRPVSLSCVHFIIYLLPS